MSNNSQEKHELYCLKKKPISFFLSWTSFRDYFGKLKTGARFRGELLFEIKATGFLFEFLGIYAFSDKLILY